MRAHPVIGVVAGCGGAGASTLAAVLAGCAEPFAFLLDCDPLGGGIDVLLGCEQVPGPRWGQVRLRGGDVEPGVLRDTLPRWQQASFLAVDGTDTPDATALAAIVTGAAQLAPVVLDLPRIRADQAAAHCDLVVLLAPAEVRALTAAAMIVPTLDPARTVLVVRGAGRALRAQHIGQLLGLPVQAVWPFDRSVTRPDGLRTERLRRRTRTVAHDLLSAARARLNRPVPPAAAVA